MPSERIQRQVDRLLDEADEAVRQLAWDTVLNRARAALALDPDSSDAHAYLAAAERELSAAGPGAQRNELQPVATALTHAHTHPESFADGRYQVKRFLGEGGKKRVYLAYDTKLDREVAFALIKTEGLDAEGEARIRREAQAMGRLGDHPHIVAVYDIGEEGGQPYLVSQLMPGGDVEALIEQAAGHRVPLETALRIADQVCQALEYAHSKGIVHRDLKPGNVWLTADPSTGSGGAVAKLGDFGLAMALDRSRLTQAGMMVGTVSYMPPEQAMGGEVTPRSDLYALGAMLYELATGRPPFVGEESVAIITQHLNTPPVAPSWHNPEVPPGLEALILRLLEKEADKRPGSAAEVREILQSVPLQILGGDRGPSPPPSPAAAGEGVSPIYRRTFVGREQERRQLQSTFDTATSGQGALVTVVGEPGIGKTALCEQLATYAAIRGGRALVGHCYEEGSVSLPYLPFVEAIRSYILARPPDELRSELGTGASDVARIVSEVREKVAVEPRPPGDPEDDRWRLYQAVTGFLRNAGSVQPLVLILEDLHWADRGTLDFLMHLSRNLAGARLLVIGTYRDVEVDRAHPLSATLAELRRGSAFARIALRGLTPDEVQRMLSNLTGQDVRWSLAEAVHRQTEGSPLFIQEVMRYLVEEGLITHEGGRWHRAGEAAPEMSIPEGLRDVIGKRLSRLSPECNRLLAIAAVVGRDFDLETLRRVAETDEEALVQGLEEALHVGVLEEQAARGVLRYRFAHAFFRQTLYEEMSGPRRLRWHQEIARALEAQYAHRLEEHAAEMAEHFAQSTDPEGLAKAVQYSQLAARRAFAVYAYGEAVRLLEQAVEVQEIRDPDDTAQRCDLLLAQGEALPAAGDPLRAAREVAPEALRLAEALGDAARATRACLIAVVALRQYRPGYIFGTPEGREWAERANQYAAPETADRVQADLYLSMVGRMAGRLRDGRAQALSALELAQRLGDAEAMFGAAHNAMLEDWLPEDQRDRLRVADAVAGWPREGVRPDILGGAVYYSGMAYMCWGDRARAEQAWREVAELAERARHPRVINYAQMADGALAILDGRLEESVERGRSVAAGDELGRGGGFLNRTFWPLVYLGRAEEVLTAVEQGTGPLDERGVKACFRALCLAHLGRADQAREALARSLGEWSFGHADDEIRADLLARLLEVAVLVGDLERLPILAARAAPASPGIVGNFYFTCVPRQLGAAAALLGDREQAMGHYQQALEVCQRLRFRPEIALTRLGIAELLLDGSAEERAEPLVHLDFAIEEFRAMKMQPSLERALRHKGLLRA